MEDILDKKGYIDSEFDFDDPEDIDQFLWTAKDFAPFKLSNLDDYINTWEDHLNSKTQTGEEYYKEINLTDIEKA